MKSFFADIVVLKKSRLRISFQAEHKPTNAQLLEMLQNDDGIEDVTDDETYEYLEIDHVEYFEEEEEEE